MPQDAVRFEDVSYTASNGISVLRGISLKVDAGESVALLGRSGSGKTTLLRMINGMALPTGGAVSILGKSVLDWDLLALRRQCGYVIQEGALFPHMTVGRNVTLLLEADGVARRARDEKDRELLQMVGLDAASVAERMPHQLSGGQRQRVGVARALARDAPLLLMDEPFGALDPLTRREMQQMLRGLLQKLDKTLVLVTHDLNEALRLASRLILLDQGVVIADLPRDEFLSSSLPAVADYRRAFASEIEVRDA